MSGFIEKAKKKVGLFVDKLRPTGGPRAPSPTPTDPNRDRDPTPIPPLVPAPHPPQAVGAKKGSVIHVLLAAAGDGFDLCLPLQVALNGVVNIWDVCEVCITPFYYKSLLKGSSAHDAGQRRVREARAQAHASRRYGECVRQTG